MTGMSAPYVIVGAAGQVGGALLEACAAKGLPAVGTVSRVPREGCDVFDLGAAADDPSHAAALVARHRPSVVLSLIHISEPTRPY